MIIGISGKKQSGKDTCAKIIQYLTSKFDTVMTFEEFRRAQFAGDTTTWEIKRFAGKLKQIVSLLTGCTLEDLENEEFKNKELGEEWYYNKVIPNYGFGSKLINWNKNLIPQKHTYRSLLQVIGTEGLRDTLHPNVHINALFADYKGIQYTSIDNCPRQGIYDVTENDEVEYGEIKTKYPAWIITDCRFVNECQAIKERDGLLIRIENPRVISNDTHASETSLDNYQFDEVIINDSSIEDLVKKVKQVLIKHNIING